MSFNVNITAQNESYLVQVEVSPERAAKIFRDEAEGFRDEAEGFKNESADILAEVTPAVNQGILDIGVAANAGVQIVEQAGAEAIAQITPLVQQVSEDAQQTSADRFQTAQDVITTGNNVTAAQAAQSGAEAARDAITDKIDFTGLVNGDILEYQGTKLVKVNPRKQAFLADTDPLRWSIYDSFERSNSTTILNGGVGLGVSDSGHTWVGNNYFIQNGLLRSNVGQFDNSNLFAYLQTNGFRKNVEFITYNNSIDLGNSSLVNLLIAYQDENNYAYLRVDRGQRISILTVIAGVETQVTLISNNFTTNDRFLKSYDIKFVIGNVFLYISVNGVFSQFNYTTNSGLNSLILNHGNVFGFFILRFPSLISPGIKNLRIESL